jgi:hypothetical protein
MASVGHVAIGLVAARLARSPRQWFAGRPTAGDMALWSAVSLPPDVDFAAIAFGLPYGSTSPWAHRGAPEGSGLARIALRGQVSPMPANTRRKRGSGLARSNGAGSGLARVIERRGISI